MRKTDINGKLVQFAWWTLATIVFTLVVAIRIRLLGIPLERDEDAYAYAGQLILQGIPPYNLAYNMKFPGTYAAYPVIMSIFGQTIHAIHLGLLLVNVATIALIFLVGRGLMAQNYTAAGFVNITPTETDYFFGDVPQSVETVKDYIPIYRRNL